MPSYREARPNRMRRKEAVAVQTFYGRSEQEYSTGHAARRKSWQRNKAAPLSRREKRRLVQLAVCIAIFAATWIGKGAFPAHMASWNEKALEALRANTDFKEAFVGLGKSISEGEPVLETLGDLWIEAFGGEGTSTAQEEFRLETPVYRQERTLLASEATGKELMEKRLGVISPAGQETAVQTGNESAGWEEREDVSQPALLEQESQPASSDSALPAGCTLCRVTLELTKTVTPAMGVISSGFGYRIHPLDGENKFHYGVDIAADEGTAIAAFADGVVDYIGESNVYGNYLQLRHAEGVTTFYAHCSKLCVKDGQKVTAGQTIAKVGHTGETTGTHLHFEIRQDGVFLNPQYYIKTS